MIKQIILTLLLIIYCLPTNANVVIGTGIMYQKINNPHFEYKDDYETLKKPSSLSIGYNIEMNRFNILASTNRIINKEIKRDVIIGNVVMPSKSKIEYDLLQIGYRKNRIMPGIFIANSRVTTTIAQYKDIEHAIVYGASLTYLYDKSFSPSLVYIAPNSELHMKGGLGLVFNLHF